MHRFRRPEIYDRTPGPSPHAATDGLVGFYAATLASNPGGGTVKVIIPALDLHNAYIAKCSALFGPPGSPPCGSPYLNLQKGASVLVVFDEAKMPWVVTGG